mmetsp:Transcript_94756/g.253456  ORF Transcript_94756/g.253456 Transcript_94756/m.253456 type:complete len:154 (-) Transcript_94756:100-561(-)
MMGYRIAGGAGSSASHRVRFASIPRVPGEKKWGDMPDTVFKLLKQHLESDWDFIARNSVCIAERAGLDELRLDWYLGDARLGPRLGELTYIGGADVMVQPFQTQLCDCWVYGHMLRSHGAIELHGPDAGLKKYWKRWREQHRRFVSATASGHT